MSAYNKFIAALVAGLGVAVTVAADGEVTAAEWLSIAAAAVGALAVYAVPNSGS